MLAKPRIGVLLRLKGAMHIYEADLVAARTRPGRFIHARDQTIIERLRCPISVIAGSLDPLGKPTPAAQTLLLQQRQPTARIRLIDGAGHWVAYEAAAEFNAAMDAALA